VRGRKRDGRGEKERRGKGEGDATLTQIPGSADPPPVNGDDFYRGFADAGEDGTALLFASTEQLNMPKVANEVYFDATFKLGTISC